MDYQKMKDYESKITLLLDNKRKGKITDKEHRKQTETLMQEAKKNLNDDEIKMLINYLQKSTNDIYKRIRGNEE